MAICMLCGAETNGSIGAAGLKWPTICPPCKEGEDRALAQSIKIQADVLNSVFETMGGDPCLPHEPNTCDGSA